jgi:hypothetical protein
MGNIQNISKDQLKLEINDDEQVTIRFLGKSILRDPTEFIMPILLSTLKDANLLKKRIILDFRDLVYMNSSTITPLIKILEKTRVGEGSITVLYRKNLKWQDISFSALALFQTPDNRIEIKGAE